MEVGQRGHSLGTSRTLSSFPATPPAVRPEYLIGVMGRRWVLAEGPPTEAMSISDQAPGLRLVALVSRFVTNHPKSGAGQPPPRIRSGFCERAGRVEVARRPLPPGRVGGAASTTVAGLWVAWASLPLPSLWVQGTSLQRGYTLFTDGRFQRVHRNQGDAKDPGPRPRFSGTCYTPNTIPPPRGQTAC